MLLLTRKKEPSGMAGVILCLYIIQTKEDCMTTVHTHRSDCPAEEYFLGYIFGREWNLSPDTWQPR